MAPNSTSRGALARDADSPSLVQAAQDVLEWAAQMGGWEVPCWERSRQAVREAAPSSESPDIPGTVPQRAA